MDTYNRKLNIILVSSIAVYFIFSIVIPIIFVIINFSFKYLLELLNDDNFIAILKNTLISSLVIAFLSTLLGTFLAFTNVRTNSPLKKILVGICNAMILVPTVSIGIGLINLFGRNGLFTNLIGINIGILGFRGLVLGSTLHIFPLSYLIISNAMKKLDERQYETSKVLGFSKIKTTFKITLPYLYRPLLYSMFTI